MESNSLDKHTTNQLANSSNRQARISAIPVARMDVIAGFAITIHGWTICSHERGSGGGRDLHIRSPGSGD